MICVLFLEAGWNPSQTKPGGSAVRCFRIRSFRTDPKALEFSCLFLFSFPCDFFHTKILSHEGFFVLNWRVATVRKREVETKTGGGGVRGSFFEALASHNN